MLGCPVFASGGARPDSKARLTRMSILCNCFRYGLNGALLSGAPLPRSVSCESQKGGTCSKRCMLVEARLSAGSAKSGHVPIVGTRAGAHARMSLDGQSLAFEMPPLEPQP